MELKERIDLFDGWDDDDDGFFEPIELKDSRAGNLSLPATVLSEPHFLSDEVYIELYQAFEVQRQAMRQAEQRAAQARRQQAQQVATKAAPPPSVSKPNGNGNGNGNSNGQAAPRSRRPSGLIISENFKGDNLPILDITTIPSVKYEVVRTDAELPPAVEALRGFPVLAVDTETNGLDPFDSKLLLVQVASPQVCYIVDAQHVNLEPLKALLEDTKVLKLLQNAKFDYKMLKQQARIELKNVYDTMLAERLLTAGLGDQVNLQVLNKKYLGETMDKSVRKTFYGASASSTYLNPDQLNYAAKDAFSLFPIYTKQLEKLKAERLLTVADVEFRCVGAVGDMELAGCKLDTVKWRQILAGVEIKRDEAREALMEILPSGKTRQGSMFGNDEYMINLNSAPQLIAEFARLGIQLEDTSEATLVKHNHPASKLLVEYKGHEKTLSAFGEGLLELIHKKTGRIHPDFIQYGADTGRFSCSNPNVQQIPATSDFRACFIPEEGYKLVTSDYSQAELRILAELSQDDGFLNAFKSGGDLHILAASQMFNIPPEQVTKVQRGQAKAINFGLAYGMGPQGLALRIDKTVEESRELISTYFKAFSGVQKWLDKAGRDSARLGYSPTPLGRKRYYHIPDQNDPDYRRKISEIDRRGKNAPIQGANADITKIALIFLKEALPRFDARLVNTVHDEIVVEVREDQAEEVCKLVEAEMIRAAKEVLKEVPVVSDAKVGDYWSK